jgi:hypothetical protein
LHLYASPPPTCKIRCHAQTLQNRRRDEKETATQQLGPQAIKMKIDREKTFDRLQVLRVDRLGKRERTRTLICGSGYHIMNNACIHQMTGDPNIYTYMKEKIYKEPYEKIQ